MHIIRKEVTPFCCESHFQYQQEVPSPPILLLLLTTTNFRLGSAWAPVVFFILSHPAHFKLFFRI